MSPELLRRMDAYWRAANYLSVGQIYLYDNPLLRQPLRLEHVVAETLDRIIAEIKRIQSEARTKGCTQRPRWPMIILKTPKGWTGPKVVDGLQVEGTYRAH